ncbi:MAG TPA: ROK family protein [Roseiflexaceae bacterium]|nr:ROK family protein [Roseiflexaceae bacterium]
MNDPKALVQERLARNSWGLLGTQGYVLGLDAGSYGLRAALVDLHSHTYASAFREPAAETAEAIVSGAIDLARGLLSDHHVATGHLVRVGVGFGGPVDARKGIVRRSPRMPGWENFPLGDRIEEAFGAATLVDNDANLIALAEATFGVAHQAQHMVYVHLSSGVGGGLVLNGHLYHGATTTAGEIGHAVVGPVDPVYRERAPATLEQHLSIKGLMRRAAELGLETNLLSDIFGDHPAGRQVVAEAADLLAVRLSQIIALIDPQMIVIGGVVARSGGEPFFQALRARLQYYSGDLVQQDVPIVPSVLGFESVAIGGIALALESMAE